MTDEKEKAPEAPVQPNDKGDYRQSADKEEAIWDMKQELEDYICLLYTSDAADE